MKQSQCTPTNEGISNDTTSAAKGAMVWEIARVRQEEPRFGRSHECDKRCHGLGDLNVANKQNKQIRFFLDKFHTTYVI
jgi:hypothetical protein